MNEEKIKPVFELIEKFKNEDRILIYGAGNISAVLYRILTYFEIDNKIVSFVVKEKESNPDSIHGISVKEVSAYVDDDIKVVIGLAYEKQEEVCAQLISQGLKAERIITLDKDTVQAVKDFDEKLFDSADYWNNRYLSGGTSGAGSYNRLAEFKAEVINQFVKEHNINSVIEWGCGDGNQLSLASYPHYMGFDVSQKAIEICKQKYREDATKEFIWCGGDHFTNDAVGELVLSLDVIFHLIEDEVFHVYMGRLFQSSIKFVCIYSSNCDLKMARHVKHRKFTDWIDANVRGEWNLKCIIKNKYPYDMEDIDNTSMSDFYIYEKIS